MRQLKKKRLTHGYVTKALRVSRPKIIEACCYLSFRNRIEKSGYDKM